MQIGSSLTSPRALPPGERPAASVSTNASDSVEASDEYRPEGLLTPLAGVGIATRFLALGGLYKLKDQRVKSGNKENPPLRNEPAVTLDQPFVLIPGWTTTKKAFAPLVEKLVEDGRNGGEVVFVSNGEFFQDRALEKHVDAKHAPGPDSKVFEVVFSDSRLPPNLAAGELTKNFAAIKDLTSAEKVDVSAYSMGGLAARVYLDEGGKDVDQLMTVGTPHRGSEFAYLAREVLRRDIGWALSFSGIIPADLPALEWLSPLDRVGSNPQLEALNERWPEQKAQVSEVRILGGIGTLSANEGLKPYTDGDGLVAADSVFPPGETPVLISGQHHSHINNAPGVYSEMRDFFHWQPTV